MRRCIAIEVARTVGATVYLEFDDADPRFARWVAPGGRLRLALDAYRPVVEAEAKRIHRSDWDYSSAGYECAAAAEVEAGAYTAADLSALPAAALADLVERVAAEAGRYDLMSAGGATEGGGVT